MRNYLLCASQDGTHLDSMKITAKFAVYCETRLQSKSHILITLKASLKESHLFLSILVPAESNMKESFNLLNQYHPLHKHKRQTNVFRQKMKHFNPSINSIYKSISLFIYNMYRDV